MAATTDTTIEAFIARWGNSGGSERSNYALFLTELCDMLGVPHPDPATDANHESAYVFERVVIFQDAHGTQTANYIDLYKRGCFILETKQGVNKKEAAEALAAATATQQQ